jgi:hypothetical protein
MAMVAAMSKLPLARVGMPRRAVYSRWGLLRENSIESGPGRRCTRWPGSGRNGGRVADCEHQHAILSVQLLTFVRQFLQTEQIEKNVAKTAA